MLVTRVSGSMYETCGVLLDGGGGGLFPGDFMDLSPSEGGSGLAR